MTLKNEFKESKQANAFVIWLIARDSQTAPDSAELENYYLNHNLENIDLKGFLEYAAEEVESFIINGLYVEVQ